ncbi:UNVERIFIED_ORG: hypothetical protein M2435_001297 [Rhizobium sophorae]|nr:hypothetical protein [Rhizobium leguminosarum]MDH6658398.1 hypothetical protein [Rhizobium sophorae]
MILACIIVYMLFCACLAMLCGALSGRRSREEEAPMAVRLVYDRASGRMGRH